MKLSPPPATTATATPVGVPHLINELPAGKRPQLRPCRTMWLDPAGQIQDSRFLVPAHDLFDAAFCAFARGTLVDTPSGPTAIEDLLPGDSVLTEDGTPRPITWIGATTIAPNRAPTARQVPLFRVMPDAFGMARPLSHLIVGPSARVLDPMEQALGSLSMMEDGIQVTRLTPPSPVELFHLCLHSHAMIRMGGMAFESYHPGHGALREVGPAMRELFMRIFPQIEHITDFGMMAHPRDVVAA